MKLRKKISDEQQWIFNDGSQPIQMRVMAAAEIQSVNHLHKTMFEYFYVLQGHMNIAVAGSAHHLEKDDLIVVEPGEPHHIIDKSEDLLLLLLMPPPVPDDKVVLPPGGLF